MSRHAKCIADLKLEVRGSKWAGSIGKGWQGDLDQVIGEREVKAELNEDGTEKTPAKTVDVSLADALGKYLTEEHFEFTAAAARRGRHAEPKIEE